jgi:hypothetical protein
MRCFFTYGRLANGNSNSLCTQSLRDTLNSERRAGISQSAFKRISVQTCKIRLECIRDTPHFRQVVKVSPHCLSHCGWTAQSGLPRCPPEPKRGLREPHLLLYRTVGMQFFQFTFLKRYINTPCKHHFNRELSFLQ